MSKRDEILKGAATDLWVAAGAHRGIAEPPAARKAAEDLVSMYEAANGDSVSNLLVRFSMPQRTKARATSQAHHFGHLLSQWSLGKNDEAPTGIKVPAFSIRLSDDVLMWSGEVDDPDDKIGVVKAHGRRRRNPEIPSEADYLGETLGAPKLNPGPTKHWYVFYWENLRDKPKSYQGPFTLESSAKTAMDQEIRKYGDADRSAYRIKHLTVAAFTEIWGSPPVLSNPACPACGAHIASGSATCPSCGIRVRATGQTATPLESPRTLVTRRGRPPGVPVGNPGAYVRVARMPTDDELARAWRYIEREYTLKEGDVDGEQWAEGLAFGQRDAADAEDRAVVREVKPQLTEVQWRQISRRADELLADQGEPRRFKE